MTPTKINDVLVALRKPEIKVKNLSTDNLFKLIQLKKELSEKLEVVASAEQALSDEYGAVIRGRAFQCADPEFFEKLKAVQSKEADVTNVNFLNKDEFTKLVSELDFDTTALLYDVMIKE